MKKINLGKNNGNWKGDKVQTGPLHNWIKRHKPKSMFCEKCGKVTDKLDCANISGKYKRDIVDYRWLCRRCHMDEDGRFKNLNFHNSDTGLCGDKPIICKTKEQKNVDWRKWYQRNKEKNRTKRNTMARESYNKNKEYRNTIRRFQYNKKKSQEVIYNGD